MFDSISSVKLNISVKQLQNIVSTIPSKEFSKTKLRFAHIVNSVHYIDPDAVDYKLLLSYMCKVFVWGNQFGIYDNGNCRFVDTRRNNSNRNLYVFKDPITNRDYRLLFEVPRMHIPHFSDLDIIVYNEDISFFTNFDTWISKMRGKQDINKLCSQFSTSLSPEQILGIFEDNGSFIHDLFEDVISHHILVSLMIIYKLISVEKILDFVDRNHYSLNTAQKLDMINIVCNSQLSVQQQLSLIRRIAH